MSRVSVLLTSYNHERWLEECIDSALNQTYDDYEVIVIDDNSSDSTRDILGLYQGRVTTILNEQNRGTYGVLNQGLEAAESEYVAVLNSDDVWMPTKLKRQVQLMDEHPEMAFCHTYGEFVDANGNVIYGSPMGFEFPRTPSGDCLAIFVANNTAIASSVLMRADLAKKLGYFDESFKNLGDWDMWLRLAEAGSVGFLDEKLVRYRVHESNTIYKVSTTWEEDARVRESCYRRRAELLQRGPALRPALAHTIACLGSLYSIFGKPAEARKMFAESMRLMPTRIKTALRYLLTFAPLSVRRKLM